MVEVQAHGFTFEKWVRETFYGGYQGNYMQEWDIPPEANSSSLVSARFRDLPVSVKVAKYGSPIGLGDILRQRAIAEPFVLIVGFWKQTGPAEKRIIEIGAVRLEVAKWESMWGTLRLEEIKMIDRRIKDLNLPYAAARRKAKAWVAFS